jgi:hypothetical protein
MFAVPRTAVGKSVWVVVTASAGSLGQAVATSIATSPVQAGILALAKAPRVGGTAAVGTRGKR